MRYRYMSDAVNSRHSLKINGMELVMRARAGDGRAITVAMLFENGMCVDGTEVQHEFGRELPAIKLKKLGAKKTVTNTYIEMMKRMKEESIVREGL